MAPLRTTSRLTITAVNTKKTTTNATVRGTTALLLAKNAKETRSKRKANSPLIKESSRKRSALGDLTNKTDRLAVDIKAKGVKNVFTAKKVTVQQKVLPSVKTAVRVRHNENLGPPAAPAATRVQTRAAARASLPNETAQKPKDNAKETAGITKVKRLSNEFEKTEESLYSTALEDINVSEEVSGAGRESGPESITTTPENQKPSNLTLVSQQMAQQLVLESPQVPDDVCDFDKDNWDDIFQVSHYARDIFNYLKQRESLFMPKDYLERQTGLTKWMRSLLVDWMVEIQESFELNHETLYLGVKLVDLYLSRVSVSKDNLQLVGAAAMFIASKFDERIPPLINDFLYICDGAYQRNDLIRMEMSLLKVCNFNLGIPISYRFLRRYARCAKVSMQVLTLARFILEYSLMDYETIKIVDSKLAAAALYLALRMKNISSWTPTLQFYTGYKLEQIISVVHLMNNGLHLKPKEQLMTVRNKYSHKVFFEVAKTPLVKNEDLD